MLICKYCSSVRKSKNSLSNHERMCKLNPDGVKSIFATEEFKKSEAYINRNISNQHLYAKERGLSYKVSDTNRENLSKAYKRRCPSIAKEIGRKSSVTIREKVANGEWHTSLAKNMLYEYKGVILHGKWELAYAEYLDSNEILWKRCIEKFEYTFEGKIRRYTPDFYLLETDEYIEIKGYKTKKDLAKWSQFPTDKKLTVLMKRELKELGII